MRRAFQILLLTLVAASAYPQAMNVVCTSKATQVVNSGDTLFIFKGSIDLKSTIGVVDWYRTDGTLEKSNSADCSPEEGGYYIQKGSDKYAPFYVFKCKKADLDMSVEPACDGTILRLTGDVSPFTYTRPDASVGTYARAYSLTYIARAWDGEAWADSLAQMTGRLSKTINLPPLYDSTTITLCYDEEIRDKLEMDTVRAVDTLAQENVKAITFHMESLTTVRGQKGEKSNELNRPTDQKCITATTADDYSGALEVAFYSNPTPNPRPTFFRWSIYKASQRIATRNDQDIRYAFSEPGSYRVVCAVNTYDCTADSTEMKVNISESYLRVPNVFTPDGNGKNDEFRVAYRSLRDFHIWVYNRWGKLVYESTDPAKGWDGNINGRKAAEGAYFYVIRAMGTDAAKDAEYIGLKAQYKKKKDLNDESIIGIYQMSGDINLLRRKDSK